MWSALPRGAIGAFRPVGVGAAVEEQCHHLACGRRDRPRERRGARVTLRVQEPRLGVEQLPHATQVAVCRREVDWQIGRRLGRNACRYDRPHMRSSFLDQVRDRLVAALPGGGHQVLASEAHEVRVRPRVEQHPDRLRVPLAHREVDGLRVPVLGTVEVRVALEQAAHRRRIAAPRGAEHVPDITAAAGPRPVGTLGVELGWLDHADLRRSRL